MPMQFSKMHGLGNDYVFIDVFEQTVTDPGKLARTISDRHRGVGSDGLILVSPPTEHDAHVRMEMYNADGSPAQMCGNGIRCVAKLAYETGRARHNPLRVQTDAGVKSLDLTVSAEGCVDAVRVNMGSPILDPTRIPVALGGERVVATPIPLHDKVLSVTCVSMGNPHAVFFTEQLARVPLSEWGPQFERHPLFPERINVHFAQVIDDRRIRAATWERGTGLTQACGTGACAVCVAGVLNQMTQRAVTVHLPGGDLEIEWNESSNDVYMTGPATEVFGGQWRD